MIRKLENGIAAFALSVVLAIASVFGSIGFQRSAEAAAWGNPEYTGVIQCPETVGGLKAAFYYTDDFFAHAPDQYDASLAQASLVLAAASCNDGSGKTQSRSVEAALVRMGFSDFQANEDYQKTPTVDSMGVAAAKKKISLPSGKYTLVSVQMRSAGYEKEWESNFDPGTEGDHKGFAESAEKAKAFLEEYLAAKKVKGDVIFWITGYSRGAAVANLLAGSLDGMAATGGDAAQLGGIALEKGRIYAYTFATPAGTIRSDAKADAYTNIFNIISPYDLVPRVAPERWGFQRFGNDVCLPQEGDTDFPEKLAAMQKQLGKLDSGTAYDPSSFAVYKAVVQNAESGTQIEYVKNPEDASKMPEFLDEAMESLAGTHMKDRAAYAGCQTAVQGLVEINYNASDSEKQMMQSYLGGLSFSGGIPQDGGTERKKIRESLDQKQMFALSLGLKQMGIRDTDAFLDSLQNLLDITEPFLTEQEYRYSATLRQNAPLILASHTPAVYLAWLQSADSGFAKKTAGAKQPAEVRCTYTQSQGRQKLEMRVYDGTSITQLLREERDAAGKLESLECVVYSKGKQLAKERFVPLSGKKALKIRTVSTKKKTVELADTFVLSDKSTWKVTTVGANAFKQCKKLKKIRLGKHTVRFEKSAFSGLKEGAVLAVPKANVKSVKKSLKGTGLVVKKG